MFCCYCKIATHASEIDGEGTSVDLEASVAPMDTDVAAATPPADENQKQSSDTDVGQEAGQSEADAEAEAGIIDGETDAEVDLDAVGWDHLSESNSWKAKDRPTIKQGS